MPLDWNSRRDPTQKPPLDLSNTGYDFRGRTLPISNLPIEVKLALMKGVISAGDNVNQLDPINYKRLCFGCPLNFAAECSRANFDYLKDNIPRDQTTP
jgi:hypothetical protein